MVRTPARMRTKSVAIDEIKAADHNTALTLGGLNRLISDGIIPHVKVGRKVLVNVDTLMDYLSMPAKVQEPALPAQPGTIYEG